MIFTCWDIQGEDFGLLLFFETVFGLYETEVIRRRGPCRHLEAVDFAILEWVACLNHRRLLEAIGYMPPVELEEAYY